MSRPTRPVQPLNVPPPHGGHPQQAQVEAEASAVGSLERYLSTLDYPIKNHAELLGRVLAEHESIEFRGARIVPRELIPQLPHWMFPIVSADDFGSKIKGYLTHPLMEVPPVSGRKKEG